MPYILVLHAISLYCMVQHSHCSKMGPFWGFGSPFYVLMTTGPKAVLLYCMVLHVIELYLIVLYGIAVYCMVMHSITRGCTMYSLYSAPANYRVVHLVILIVVKVFYFFRFICHVHMIYRVSLKKGTFSLFVLFMF